MDVDAELGWGEGGGGLGWRWRLAGGREGGLELEGLLLAMVLNGSLG